ncbi:MAG: DUF4388 domain-containing protein [Myxococcota bacterium]
MNAQSPAQLGADDVIRFADTAHFQRELAGNLGRGRVFVRTRRKFELRSIIQVKVEVPSSYDLIDAAAEVVFNRDGFLGLELVDFIQTILPIFERWTQIADGGLDPDTVEQTIVGPAPIPEAAMARSERSERANTATRSRRRPAVAITADLVPEVPPPRRRRPNTDDLAMFETTRRIPTDSDDEPPAEALPLIADAQVTPDAPITPNAPTLPPELDPARAADALTVESQAPVDLQDIIAPEAPTPNAETAAPVDEALRGGVAAAGLDALQDRQQKLMRTTPGGVLTVTDPIDLLGLYLSQVRHGSLTVFGGPSGGLGERVRVKVRGLQVIDLVGEVVARVGDWLTLSIDDPDAMRTLVADAQQAWAAAIANLAGAPLAAPQKGAAASASRPSAPKADLEAHDAKHSDETPPAPSPDDAPQAKAGNDDASSPKSSNDLPPPASSAESADIDAAPKPAATADPAPKSAATADAAPAEPVPPRLENDMVVFAHRDDLKREMEANLKNGGLFVISEPIEIRSKRRLRVKVGADVLPVTLETDVVFANGGRVGFSVANTPSAQNDLRKYLSGELPLDAPGPDSAMPQTGGLQSADIASLNEDAVRSSDVQTFAGKLAAPPDDRDLISLQDDRVEDPAELGAVSVLRLFEYIVRKRWKGVLTVRDDDQVRRVWTHEGSVAFIESEPFEESTGLGRLLVSQKKVSEAQLREALDKSRQTNRSLGRSLVLLGTLKRADITSALREQVRLKMDNSFTWRRGRYEWTPWTEPPGQADLILTRGIGVMARHIRSRLEHLNIGEVEGLFGRSISRTVGHAADVDTVATSLQLMPRDLRFLELQVDGTKTITDAVLGSPLGRLASLRLVALGLALGFVKFTDRAQPRKRDSTASGGANPAEKRIKAEMQERLLLLKSQNHFERLGVHWSAHHRSYRAAYDKAMKELDLKKPPLKGCPDEIKALVRQLRSELESAFRGLNDAQQRTAYRKKLFDKTEREYASDMLVKQGEVALMRGDRMQAIECLETAVELNATQRNRSLLTSARGGRA